MAIIMKKIILFISLNIFFVYTYAQDAKEKERWK